MTLHNYFEIERYTGTKLVEVTRAYNLVKNNAYTKIMAGEQLPTTITLGKGTGTPVVGAPNNIFSNSLGLSNVSRQQVFNKEAQNFEYTYTHTLTPEQNPGLVVTEIGVGSSTDLWTHAMITDANGNPITLVKGELERWIITAKVYIDISGSITGDPNKILQTDMLGLYHTLFSVHHQVGTSMGTQIPFKLSNLALNAGAQSPIEGMVLSGDLIVGGSSTVSGATRTYPASISTSSGNGTNINAFNLSGEVEGRGAQACLPFKQIDNNNRPYTVSAQPLNTGTGVTRKFQIPLSTDNIDSIKIFKDGVLQDKSSYSLIKYAPFIATVPQRRNQHIFKWQGNYYRWLVTQATRANWRGNTNQWFAIQKFITNEDGTLTAGKIIPLSDAAVKAMNGQDNGTDFFCMGHCRCICQGSYSTVMHVIAIHPETGELLYSQRSADIGYAVRNLVWHCDMGHYAEVSDDLTRITSGFATVTLGADGTPSLKHPFANYSQFPYAKDNSLKYPLYTNPANKNSMAYIDLDGVVTTKTYLNEGMYRFKNDTVRFGVVGGKVTLIKYDGNGTELSRHVSTETVITGDPRFINVDDIVYTDNKIFYPRPDGTLIAISVAGLPAGVHAPVLYGSNGWLVNCGAISHANGWFYEVEFNTAPADGVALTYDLEVHGITKSDQWALNASVSITVGW